MINWPVPSVPSGGAPSGSPLRLASEASSMSVATGRATLALRRFAPSSFSSASAGGTEAGSA